jgi:thiamine-phosphate pyrophosphorylase
VLALPRIYPILDTELLRARGIAPETAAAAFLEGGASILQLRHKGHWTREVFACAQTVARLCRDATVQLIVNDRADFALLLHAGLHLGQDDLPPDDARKLLGAEAIIGFSTHSPAQLCSAEGYPVDYLAIGPIFTTQSKRNPDPVVGLDELRRCRSLSVKPLVAIGGISLENAADVFQAGADSLAILSGMLPESASPRALRERMEAWQRLARAA